MVDKHATKYGNQVWTGRKLFATIANVKCLIIETPRILITGFWNNPTVNDTKMSLENNIKYSPSYFNKNRDYFDTKYLLYKDRIIQNVSFFTLLHLY